MTVSGPERALVLRSDPASAALARGFLKEALADVPEEARELAALGASELVANVLLHTACGSFTLTVNRDAGGIQVGVHDDSPSPVVYRDADSDAEDGRGLQIVDGLASRWGVSFGDGRGKCVWFRLETA